MTRKNTMRAPAICFSMLCAAMIGAAAISGCGGSSEPERSTVSVDKKGVVTMVDVEPFDPQLYDEEEFRAFVDDSVASYAAEHGEDAVQVKGISVGDSVARLTMRFATPEDFSSFRGVEFYHGKIADAIAAGYIYDGTFARVEKGEVAGSATKQDIYAEPELRTVIIRANTDLKVDGDICYVSCENVRLEGRDKISIRPGYFLSGESAGETEDSPGESGGTESVGGAAGGTELPESSAADLGSAMELESAEYTFVVYK